MIFCLILQIKKAPFYDDRLNTLELTSLYVQITIIYFGLYYQTGRKDPFVLSKGTMWCILFLIIIASINFIGLFMIRMRMEVLKATVIRSNFFFKIFSCGRIKDKEAFIQEHKIGLLNQRDEVTLNKHGELVPEKAPLGLSVELPSISRIDDSAVNPKDVKVKFVGVSENNNAS